VFCEEGKDNIEHCNKVKAWFREMSSKGEDIIEQLWGEYLDKVKGKVLRRICKEKEKRLKAKEKDREIGTDPTDGE